MWLWGVYRAWFLGIFSSVLSKCSGRKSGIRKNFLFAQIALERAVEIEGFIVLVFKECEIDEGIFTDEVEGICTVEEIKEYFNKAIFNSLSEERQKYLRSIFEDTGE